MRSFALCLLLLTLSVPAYATPWDLAGRAPADVGWVVAWEFQDEVRLKPFWDLAIRLDEEIGVEGIPTLGSILAATGFSLDELANFCNGSGIAWRSGEEQSWRISVGLRPGSKLDRKLHKLWKLNPNEPTSKGLGPFTIECSSQTLEISYGPTFNRSKPLTDDSDFREARSKLGERSTIVAFRGGATDWRYAAASLDLSSQTSLATLAFHRPLDLKTQNVLPSPSLYRRPAALSTMFLLHPEQLAEVLSRLGNDGPKALQKARQFVERTSSEGRFYEIIQSPGMIGTDTNPLELLLQPSSPHTLFAKAPYRSLESLESFLGDLEYDVRLKTLEECERNLIHLTYHLRRYEVDLKQPTPKDFQPLIPELIKGLPNCPAAGRPTYVIGSKPEGSFIYCSGDHHPQTQPNFPRFDGKVVRGETRQRPSLKMFSRLNSSGRASYRLVSGQRIEVNDREKSVALADGKKDRDFLQEAREAKPFPKMMAENLEWTGDRLLYLDYTDITSSVEDVDRLLRLRDGDRVTPILAAAFLEGLSQGDTTEGSNALRWDKDGLSYRGRGLWSGPVLLSSLTTTPLLARAQRRERKLEKARACRDNLQELGVALNRYRAKNGTFPDGLKQLVPDYLATLPVCPVANKDTYSESYYWEHRSYYQHTPDKLILELCCLGYYHTKAGWEENHPRYDLQDGVRPKP